MNALLLVLAVAAQTVFSFTDARITESSGLVDLGSLMVTTNDSGDGAVLYVIDPRTGDTVGETRYASSVTDVEALAPAGPGEVWAADIGDNRESRSSVQVHRVPVGRGERQVEAPSYRLTYPDGAHDAESLVTAGARLYLITKGLLGGTVYVAPQRLDPDGANRLRSVATVDVFATDAALFPDGKHILVRGYGDAEVYTFPGFEPVGSFALPDQEQGEGVSIGPGGRVRISSEGEHSAVLQVTLPGAVRRAMEPRATPSPTAPATTPAVTAPESDPARSDDDDGSPFQLGPVIAGGIALTAVAIAVAGWRRRRRR